MYFTSLREPAYRIYRFRLEELLKIPIGATDEDLFELIEAGVPASISSTFFRLGMTPPGVREQLISSGAPAVLRLTKDESRRLFRVASVCALALAIFGDDEKAVRWL
ncbi:antitoxin [Pseudomonas fluorescens]|jgi:hypothetical protein|uniref:antitoxin n=1 Tax=Pseudomonas fluorescens TaxID=294 RepID=UPI00123EE10B|nr:antitoxin [Pseudomonas fluorescens]